MAPYHVVRLDEIEVHVRCGLHPWERHPERPNRLLITVHMYADLARERPADWYIDYDRMREVIVGWAQRDHVDLLETLLQDAMTAAFADDQVDAVMVRVAKPDIFPETRAAAVERFLRREDLETIRP